jgi:osmotically-inducible protein OsmY
MSQSRHMLCLILALSLPLALGGCPAAIVAGLGAAGGTGYAANQERGVGGTFNDSAIKTNIQNAWLNSNPLMQRDFDITVYQGRVLLTGTSPNPELKNQAKQLASQVQGVQVVYDEIEVGPTEGAWQSAKDTWITSQVRSNLVFAGDVRSVNYTIDTVNGSVYLIGSARSQTELDKVTDVARKVPNVKRVVSYVEIRPGQAVTAQQTPAPQTSRAPMPDQPAAAPATAVESQKL